jgi:uncharacterized protein (TIGR03437 family)
LRSIPKPTISPGGIVNALSYTGGGIAPGEFLSIFGSNFGSVGLQINTPENNRLQGAAGRTKVLFTNSSGSAYGPITAITPNQINVFAPSFLDASKPVNVTVQVDGTASDLVSMPVADVAPGIFPGAVNQDGSLNSSTNPALRGSIISLFGTGHGLSTPQLAAAEFTISTPFSLPTARVTVAIGGQPAEVTYAGAAALQPAGVLQINTRVPTTVAPGNAAVSVSVGGIPAKQVAIAVR